MTLTAHDLQRWRRLLKWTQRSAAEYLGVPLTTYERWEAGKRRVANPGPVKKLMGKVGYNDFTKEVQED